MARISFALFASLLIPLAGCTHDNQTYDRRGVEVDQGTSLGVPRSARRVDETRGGRLDFSVPDDGRAYLADDSAHTVIWDGRVRRGDRIYINPDKNRIELNGKKQADLDLKSNHRFVLFFDRH
jgi:hypothetical protein